MQWQHRPTRKSVLSRTSPPRRPTLRRKLRLISTRNTHWAVALSPPRVSHSTWGLPRLVKGGEILTPTAHPTTCPSLHRTRHKPNATGYMLLCLSYGSKQHSP